MWTCNFSSKFNPQLKDKRSIGSNSVFLPSTRLFFVPVWVGTMKDFLLEAVTHCVPGFRIIYSNRVSSWSVRQRLGSPKGAPRKGRAQKFLHTARRC